MNAADYHRLAKEYQDEKTHEFHLLTLKVARLVNEAKTLMEEKDRIEIQMDAAESAAMKAGRQSDYQGYLKSDEWQEIRGRKLKAAGRKCERCSETKRLEVHHLVYREWGTEKDEDLEVLCRKCHQQEHVA